MHILLFLIADSRPIYAVDWLPETAQIPWVQALAGTFFIGLLAIIVHLIVKSIVIKIVYAWAKRSSVTWDNTLFDNKVPQRFSLLVPLAVLRLGLEWVPALSENLESFLQRLVASMMILVIIRSIDAVLSALHQIYLTLPLAGRRPIKSYIQLAKVIVYCFGFIFIFAQLANLTPWFFVSGLGAMMAIILLIFRDTLLSLVASVQLTSNDLIRVGDWIEMPQFGADGDVVDIALNTVKIQNWDRTVTVVPTNKFLEHSFRNYRDMVEGEGRRIMRSININSSTIRFLTEREVDRFSEFALLKSYIPNKVQELAEYNSKNASNGAVMVNARHLTNIGTLRAYILAYLRNHPNINPKMTLMVRQLEPTPEGVPIQIYTFTNDTRWVEYENIQADIFDHILASLPEFGLSLYQRPSGHSLDAVTKESVE
ncbi:MAG: mechanosensitive ion channel family protein [Balneolales bacterium]